MDYTELIGYIAASCTTFSFLPQAIKTWKTKSAKDLSLGMFLLFVIGVLMWLIYGYLLMSWPMLFANTITLVLAGSILYYKLKFG
ncbi:MAG: SemiSWEET family sugar transporter [Cyclobacteriaceae bacterium]